MKRKHFYFSLLFVTVAFSIMLNSCKKDPSPLELDSLMAGAIDLNGVTSPSNVPVNPTIVATFNVAVDPLTATTANITMVQDYDDAPITITVTPSGKTITIVPQASLSTGALYQLSFGAGLKSTDDLPITAFQRTFTTEGAFAPAGAIAHFTFEDNANDVVGAYDPLTADVIDITYTASRNAAAGKAATFNGTTSIIEIPNGNTLLNTTFSLAYWIKTNSAGKTTPHFVMGLAAWHGFYVEIYDLYQGGQFRFLWEPADHSAGASDAMWFEDGAALTFSGWTYVKNLTRAEMQALLKDNWLQVVFTYDGPTKVATLYYNGQKMKSFDFNLYPDGHVLKGAIGPIYDGNATGNNLALGFIQGRNNRNVLDTWADYADPLNNHFKGQLDDIRVWHKTITASEVLLMYNSEKP